MSDLVHHPSHYLQHKSGVEVIELTEGLSFNLGNALKYLLRHEHKGDPVTDLRKALWYIDRELNRRYQAGPREDFVQWSNPGALDTWLKHEPDEDLCEAVEALCQPSRDDTTEWVLDLGWARAYIAMKLGRLERAGD